MFLRQFASASRSDLYFLTSSHVISCLSYVSQCDVPHVCNKHILMFKSLVKTYLELYLLLPCYFSMCQWLHCCIKVYPSCWFLTSQRMIPYMLHDVSCCLLLSVNSKAAFNNEWHIFIRWLSLIWMMLEGWLSVAWVLFECYLNVTWMLLGCYLSVTWVLLECYLSVTLVIIECYWSVTWV